MWVLCVVAARCIRPGSLLDLASASGGDSPRAQDEHEAMIAAFAKALLGASSWRILHKEQSVWKAARCMRAKSFYIM